ncbi:tetratricopeptide repeat protein [Desulfobacula toluolica]|uniref:Tetratricopeptide repeat protein n=1 Tax=Desulfobacula toluolica (strain DSM 7467 / Tol2) TaxID=651182 RepID=K0NHA6_DESTT|nr:tetratricopeptide repeat protein [Desulfobacula toluolica]CCK79243.1 tetratricopeptide repeat protein [Desulfobacula toluolica Tol2]
MTVKFSSKEIHFLKKDSDNFKIKPPETYFSDLLLTKKNRIKAFQKKLSEVTISWNNFLCAVLELNSDRSESIIKNKKETLETFFNSFPDHKKGIWKCLSKTSFIMAFCGYESEKKAANRLVSLKEKLSTAFRTEILMGVAKFPCHDFSKPQTVVNALKAADHAAFFGPDTLIHFDAVSINISADRLYQLNKYNMAIKEYKKGLEIEPNNINLINSLGVCFGVMGKLDNAKLEFEKALKINPNEVMVIYNTGLLYQINGNLYQAIQCLHKAHDIDDCVFEVEFLLGKLLFKIQQFDRAMAHLEAASRINPESGLVFRIKGEIYLAKNQPEKAGIEFNKAVKLNPLDAVALSGYAKSMLLQDKNLNIAISLAKKSIAIQPANSLFKDRLKAIMKKIEVHASQEEKIKSAS